MKNLHQFLKDNQLEILKMTETKTLELAGIRPSSDILKQGLPIFLSTTDESLNNGKNWRGPLTGSKR